jgi:hypothetical protein
MNDTELDELLDTWSAPPAPASLRENVRAGFAAGPERKASPGVRHWIAALVPSPRKRLVAGTILAVGTFLLAVTLAVPQAHKLVSPPVRIPYIVDSDIVRYADDGSPAVEVSLESYNSNGSEIVLYETSPSFFTGIRLVLDTVGSAVGRLTLPYVVSSELLERRRSAADVSTGFEHYLLGSAADLIHAGCVSGVVVGRETILNYPTVAVQPSLGDHRRVTLWMAPDLSCFALRITIEEQQPDGTFRLVTRKEAIKVTLNGEK